MPTAPPRPLGLDSAFYTPSPLQTQASESTGRPSFEGLQIKQETTPVLRPVPQYSGSETSSVATGGAGGGADNTVKFCGNCHHATEHMVVPMKTDGATID